MNPKKPSKAKLQPLTTKYSLEELLTLQTCSKCDFTLKESDHKFKTHDDKTFCSYGCYVDYIYDKLGN
jgi:hypothetical protein